MKVECDLAAGQAAADDDDVLADFFFTQQVFDCGHGALGSRDGKTFRDRTGGDDDGVSVQLGEVGDLRTELDRDTQVGHLLLEPGDELFVVLLEFRSSRRDEDTAELVRLFIDGRVVAAQFQDTGRFHTADTAADDGNVLRMFGRDDLVLVVLHGPRVDGAVAHVHGVGQVLIVVGALVLREVEAAGVAADTRTDVVFLIVDHLRDPFGVCEELTADGHGSDLAFGNGFGADGGLHLAGADARLVSELLDVRDIFEAAVVRHVLRRMCPVPGIVCTVVAVEHVIACVGQVLDGALGLFHGTADFDVVFAGHGAGAVTLGLGDDGVTQRDREVVAAFALDLFDDLDRETITVLEGSAVFVGTEVAVRKGELVEQVTFVDCVDLDTVDAGFLDETGGLAERVDDVVDLFLGEGLGLHLVGPAVRGGRGGRRQVLRVHDGAGDLVDDVVLTEHGHHLGESHGAAKAGGHLDEHLGAGLVELVHELLELVEFPLVLVQPCAAEDVLDGCNAGQDQAAVVLGDGLQKPGRFLVEMVGFRPPEDARSAHGSKDDPVLDLDIADLPRGK